ncbi:MAG TPA: class I SAM-dependent methyltransferase [Planctomycetaceae bacterium]|nr:class I SAM-dependent methyltransferase [Planctomycetaceae bacterium]
MIAPTTTASELGFYVCPACKHVLQQEDAGLRCAACSQTYPIIQEAVPDFIREELSESKDPVFRRMRAIDRMAGIYESKLWYPLVLNLYGGWHSATLPQLIGTVAKLLESTTGRVLDVACGPGTYGRRVASPAREVFGIDISKGMLRQGAAYIASEGVRNMHFARARVEALPFENEFFDAAICCGSLHLFTDTVTALREIARVLKPAAMLCVFTFTAGRAGILKFRRVREWSSQNHGLHVFTLPEMEQNLAASGFADFDPKVSGSILTFSARKQARASA